MRSIKPMFLDCEPLSCLTQTLRNTFDFFFFFLNNARFNIYWIFPYLVENGQKKMHSK